VVFERFLDMRERAKALAPAMPGARATALESKEDGDETERET